jgi:hypothetical protein
LLGKNTTSVVKVRDPIKSESGTTTDFTTIQFVENVSDINLPAYLSIKNGDIKISRVSPDSRRRYSVFAYEITAVT